MEILKVSAKSNPVKVAGAIAGTVEKGEVVELHSIGAGALNQSVKGVAIARGMIAPKGYDLVCEPGFLTLDIDGEERTGIRLIVRIW